MRHVCTSQINVLMLHRRNREAISQLSLIAGGWAAIAFFERFAEMGGIGKSDLISNLADC